MRTMITSVLASVLLAGFTGTAPARGYALCAFTATYTPKHIDYGDEPGAAWIDSIYFFDGDPIPTEREMEDAFADYARAQNWSSWNPRYDNESVDCKINRNSVPGQARRNEKKWEAGYRSRGWKVHGVGGIYWWDSSAGHAKELLIQNRDWRGPVHRH